MVRALRSPLPKKRPLAFDAVIFDLDNVLVDTRRSYLEAIRWTVDLYLLHGSVPFFRAPKKNSPQILSLEDVEEFKLLGGFNDDWDCCYGLLVYLLNLPVKGRTLKDLKAAVDVKDFVASIKKRPLGVPGIVRRLGRPSQVTIEKIARIFQEIYLGKNLFERIEKKEAAFWQRRGLIHKERLIFRISSLQKLKKNGVAMGIATGRSRFEALFALRHFHIQEFFNAITTMDDVRKAEKEMRLSLRKPHPFSILETAKKIGKKKRFVYVGDLPDDILATTRASEEILIASAAFLACTPNSASAHQAIEKTKPDFTFSKPSQLHSIVERGR